MKERSLCHFSLCQITLILILPLYNLTYFFQVKYLGEDGERTPLAGAVAICSPWDLLVSVFTIT